MLYPFYISGSLEGIAIAENMMEHIAREIGKDPIEVRLANLNPADNGTMKELLEDLRMNSEYDTRKKAINAFNDVRMHFKLPTLTLIKLNHKFTKLRLIDYFLRTGESLEEKGNCDGGDEMGV